MIPVSLLVVVVGGWTAVYLTDLVLKVRASGCWPKPAVPRARGLSPYLAPSRMEAAQRVATCSLPRGARAPGVNKAWRATGGVWRSAQQPQSRCGVRSLPILPGRRRLWFCEGRSSASGK